MTGSRPTSTFSNANTLWAHVLVDEFARSGLRHVCIAPGSRSTPLVVQFAAHPDIQDHSIIDERSAGFFALGLAQITDQPVAILCTSGTAAANLFPAVCEASAAKIPLLILTADRPPELQGVGASQAMDQTRLFGTHARAFHQVAQPEAMPFKLRYLRGLACRAYAQSTGHNPGPVHLNLPFRKPLAPVMVDENHPDQVPADLAIQDAIAVHGRPEGRPFLQISTGRLSPNHLVVQTFVDTLIAAERPILFAGADPHGRTYRAELFALANTLQIPIIAEPTSSLRHTEKDGTSHPPVIPNIDVLLTGDLYERIGTPDLIVRIGKAPLLWSTQSWIRDLHDIDQVLIGPSTQPCDPDHISLHHICCHVEKLLRPALDLLTGSDNTATLDSSWLQAHQVANKYAATGLHRELQDQPLSTPAAWKDIGESLPASANLFVSNSMPIRDLDTFLGQPRGPIDIYFNRGINGIDGIVSTGFGIARGSVDHEHSGPTVIITGDIALRHDIGSLIQATELEIDATIVVLDNDGGAIFDYLPIKDHQDIQERHFLTSGRRTLDPSACGPCEIWSPQTREDLRKNLVDSFERPGVQILHVQTDHRHDQQLRTSLKEAAATHEPS